MGETIEQVLKLAYSLLDDTEFSQLYGYMELYHFLDFEANGRPTNSHLRLPPEAEPTIYQTSQAYVLASIGLTGFEDSIFQHNDHNTPLASNFESPLDDLFSDNLPVQILGPESIICKAQLRKIKEALNLRKKAVEVIAHSNVRFLQQYACRVQFDVRYLTQWVQELESAVDRLEETDNHEPAGEGSNPFV